MQRRGPTIARPARCPPRFFFAADITRKQARTDFDAYRPASFGRLAAAEGEAGDSRHRRSISLRRGPLGWQQSRRRPRRPNQLRATCFYRRGSLVRRGARPALHYELALEHGAPAKPEAATPSATCSRTWPENGRLAIAEAAADVGCADPRPTSPKAHLQPRPPGARQGQAAPPGGRQDTSSTSRPLTSRARRPLSGSGR